MQIKQMGVEEWSTYYANPHNYAQVFQDLAALLKKAYTSGLSSSEQARRRVLNALMDEDRR